GRCLEDLAQSVFTAASCAVSAGTAASNRTFGHHQLFFTSRTLSSNSTAQARSPAKANAGNGLCGSVHDSLPDGSCEVDSLPGALSDFLEPRSWIGTMNHAPQKAQPLGCIIGVSTTTAFLTSKMYSSRNR